MWKHICKWCHMAKCHTRHHRHQGGSGVLLLVHWCTTNSCLDKRSIQCNAATSAFNSEIQRLEWTIPPAFKNLGRLFFWILHAWVTLKGLQLVVGARRSPRLLVLYICIIWFLYLKCIVPCTLASDWCTTDTIGVVSIECNQKPQRWTVHRTPRIGPWCTTKLCTSTLGCHQLHQSVTKCPVLIWKLAANRWIESLEQSSKMLLEVHLNSMLPSALKKGCVACPQKQQCAIFIILVSWECPGKWCLVQTVKTIGPRWFAFAAMCCFTSEMKSNTIFL